MATENTVSGDFFYRCSSIVKSVFDCRLPSVLNSYIGLGAFVMSRTYFIDIGQILRKLMSEFERYGQFLILHHYPTVYIRSNCLFFALP